MRITKSWRETLEGPNPFCMYPGPGRDAATKEIMKAIDAFVASGTHWPEGAGERIGRLSNRHRRYGIRDSASQEAVYACIWRKLGKMDWRRKKALLDRLMGKATEVICST